MQVLEKLLPMTQLSDKAREVHMLQGIKNTLLSVSQCADKCYTTIFHPDEGNNTVHKPDSMEIKFTSEAILQCWWDVSGLWHVPI